MTKRSKIILIVVLVAAITALLFTLLFNMGWIRSRKGALPHDEAKVRYPYSQLSATEKALYGTLCTGIQNYEEKIKLPGTFDKATYERVFLLVCEQEPQFFYLDSVYETAELMDTATMRYDVPKDDIGMMQEEIDVAANTIISAASAETDDIRKLLAIHDGIAEMCAYKDGDYQDEAYGCLAQGEAKCEGYAKAFLYVARKAGFNVMAVTGVINGTENHVWNIAEANGKFYNIDVTWDDSVQYKGHITHTCFAVPDELFGDHSADLTAYQPPVCDDDTQNYYALNMLTASSAAELPSMASTWLGDPLMLEFRLTDDAVVQDVAGKLATWSEMRDAVKVTSGAMSYRAFMDENRRVLVILPS